MDLQTKLYLIFFLIFAVVIIQMAIARKKAFRTTQFPLMINSFKADFSTLNSLKISYYVKYAGYSFELHPLMPAEIMEYLKDYQKEEKFNQKKSKSFFIMLKIHSDKDDLNELIKNFSLKFDVVKINERQNQVIELLIKEKFTQFNLNRMSLFLGDFLKKQPYLKIVNEELINENSNIIQ